MAKGKLILICQSGGEFVTNDDGTMSYNGGEANAANVTSETPFNDLKLNLAETCNLNQETMTVKYFLPGNKRNLITVKNDKDVKRMIDFHGDALTAEVFVTGAPGFDRSALDKENNRQSGSKNDETVNNDNASTKKDVTVKRGKVGLKKDKKVKKEQGKVGPTSPAKRTRRRSAVATAKTESSSHENKEKKPDSDDAVSDDSTTSADSEHVNENVNSDCSSDYVPISKYPKRKKGNSLNDSDVNASPADSVKKRRRTPSWKLGANGQPTIVNDESLGSKSKSRIRKQKEEGSGNRKSQRKSGRLAAKEEGSRETKSGRKRGRPRATITNKTDQEVDDDVAPYALVIYDDNVAPEALKSKEQVLGSDNEAYNKLPWFCEKILETNPDSISKLVVNENKRFKSLYVSFYASLCGFQNSCRPVIFLEATSLRSKYGEVLFTANAIDGNDGFFVVAFCIVDVEDDNNWLWFLEQLKDSLLNSHPITFVFDKEKNLKTSILKVFQDCYIGYSIYHLLESFKRNVKGPFHGDGKSFLPVHFLAAAHAVRPVGFRKSMDQIKQISSQAYDWVMEIESQHWSTSSFKGERYNYITDDVGESVSKLMEDHRELPILNKIDVLIRTMIDAINDAELDASMWSTHLTPLKEKQLQEENMKSCGLKVLISSDTLFEVREDSTHVVNISTWSCTCLGWKETGLPCRHALAVFNLIGKNPYEFCLNYFTVDAYRLTYLEPITPVPIEKEEKIEQIETKNSGGENEESEKIEVEEEKGEKIEVKEEKGEKMETENSGVVNEETQETEGNNDEAEDEKGEKEEELKAGDENVEDGKVEDEKVEVEKDEGEKSKVGEENDDINVLVLPPIPLKPVEVNKEIMEWDETEVETKRTVTCTKCKQPGHNKKSCNFYQVKQAC